MISFACWMAVATAGLALEAAAEPVDNPIFAPEAKLEPLFERTAGERAGLTEGPAAAPDGSIYFTDIPGRPDIQTTIYRYDPRTEKTEPFTNKGSKANGMVFDGQGRLVVCDGADGGGRLVARWNVETGERIVLADRVDGRRFNSPNDLCVDLRGRIYFSDPRYGGSEPLELKNFSVYRIDPDGKLALLTREVEMPNGVALSPDERTLYVGDYHRGDRPASERGVMRIYAFPLDDDGQVAGPRRTLVESEGENICDGLTVDAAGNLYVTCRIPAKPGVLVVDPEGKELAFFPTGPANQREEARELKGIPSNVEFGVGEDSHTLYLTIDTGFYRIRTKATGAPRVWAAGKP